MPYLNVRYACLSTVALQGGSGETRFHPGPDASAEQKLIAWLQGMLSRGIVIAVTELEYRS